MKKYITSFAFIALSCLLTIGCSKKSVNATNPPTTDTIHKAGALLISGNWIIGLYSQKTEDKTSLFANAVFTFSNNGSISVSSNGKTITGTWSYSPSTVGYYGGPPSKASLTLNMGTEQPFNLLNKTWNNDSTSTGYVSLVSPEPIENQHVHFIKQ